MVLDVVFVIDRILCTVDSPQYRNCMKNGLDVVYEFGSRFLSEICGVAEASLPFIPSILIDKIES